MELLESLPGIDRVTAAAVLAEIGVEMSRFPTAAHLASWAGLYPGNRESAGVQKSGRIRKGNTTLRATLNQCAWAAAHTRGTQLKARYEHLLPKRGKQLSHQMLVLIHFMLTENVHYSDPGWKPKLTARYLTRRALSAVSASRLVSHLQITSKLVAKFSMQPDNLLLLSTARIRAAAERRMTDFFAASFPSSGPAIEVFAASDPAEARAAQQGRY